MARKRLKRRYGRNRSDGESSFKRNPPLATDVMEWVGPGFAGFAVARFTTRIAATQIAKRKPRLGKHAGAAAAIAAFLAAWFLANRWKAISKWQMPIVVGAGLAAIQSLIQLYIPKLGWMVSDATPELEQRNQHAGPSELPDGSEFVEDDPDDYVYDERYDAGRTGAPQQTADARAAGAGAAQQTSDEDMLADLDLEDVAGQTQSMGIFNN